MTHYWRIRKTLPDRFGHPCRIVATGRLNSIMVEFGDGVRHVVNRYSVRRLTQGARLVSALARFRDTLQRGEQVGAAFKVTTLEKPR